MIDMKKYISRNVSSKTSSELRRCEKVKSCERSKLFIFCTLW